MKKRNKGFSLVELIVVIAIMAVLVVVLTPAYLRYVDKSRLQKDISAIGEVVEAIKVAAAEEAVANEIELPDNLGEEIVDGIVGAVGGLGSTYAKVIITNETGIIAAKKVNYLIMEEDAVNLRKEVTDTVGEVIEFKTEELKKLDVVLHVTRDANYNIQVTVNANAFKNYPEVREGLAQLGVSALTTDDICSHPSYTNGVCDKCAEVCTHGRIRNEVCTTCQMSIPCEGNHSWGQTLVGPTGVCEKCNRSCTHEGHAQNSCGVCTMVENIHTWDANNKCVCGKEKCVNHTWDGGTIKEGYCLNCGYQCLHEAGYDWKGSCKTCGWNKYIH